MMKKIKTKYKIIQIVGFSLIAVGVLFMYVPSDQFPNVKGRDKLLNFRSVIQKNFGIESKYSEEISIAKTLQMNGSKIVFFDRFYNENVPRHARATLTAFLGRAQEVGELPYVFLSNGEIFKVTGKSNNKERGVGYDRLSVQRIKSNLDQIVKTKFFFQNNPIDRHGIKDVTITKKGDVLVGHTDKDEVNNCTYASILWAPIPIKNRFEFKQIFKTECINLTKGQEHGNAAHMVGARVLYNEKRDKLLLSVGMLNNFLLPQNNNSSYGKILEIDISLGDYIEDKMINPKVRFIAKGVRNPQGLALCGTDVILSSHGPKGGDEVNHISLLPNKYPVNFGWPIVSYGTHYDGTYGDTAPNYAPMFQDHTEYGFRESFLNFTPSVAPSQLLTVKKDNDCRQPYDLWLATMGYRDNPGQKSIHKYKVVSNDGDLSLLSKTVYPLGGRIRDIENDDNLIWFWDETNGQLGYLTK